MDKKDIILNFKASEHWVRDLDNWRRKQSPIPSRSEAIRTLTASGLKK